MTTKEKYTEIVKEVVRNEAVSHDKLKMLAEKHGANKLKIQGYLRKAGVIERMGKGVNRVLIRGEEIEPHVEEILVLTKGGYKKKEELDMSLPGKWTSTKEQTDNALFDDPDIEAAVNGIDLHQRMLEMIEGLNTRITNQNALIEGIESQVDTFMEQVQTQINKQNEYIAELENRHDKLIDLVDERIKNAIEPESGADEIKKQIEMLEHHRIIHDNRIQALQLITKGHKTEISNGGVLKALHQLLGEII